jgi:outer membrane protein TolC
VYIRTAENSQKIAASEIRRVALVTLSTTVQAYWDLVGAIQNLEVRKQSLDNALRLVEINKQRLEIGTAAAIEVLQAKAEAASRQSELIVARMNILDAEDVLKNYIYPEETKDFLTMSIIPTTRPAIPSYEWNLEKSISTALQQRPELEAAQLYIENAELEVGRTQNELLPQLDTNVIYSQSARDFDHGDIPEGVRDKQGHQWTIGVTGSIPIGNRSAKGSHIYAQQVERQEQRRLAKLQQDIEVEVRRAIRGVVTSEILIESNRQARILQEANVVAEEKRLKLGVTTSQGVLDRQEDLTAAQTLELQSTVDYEKALIQLQMSEGTLLDHLNVSLDRIEEDPQSNSLP